MKFFKNRKEKAMDNAKNDCPENQEPTVEEMTAEQLQLLELEKKLNETETLAASYLDKLQRTVAEYENFRRRNLKEKEERFDDGVKDAMLKILPVVDNFERALASVEDKDNKLYEGIAMVHRQLTNAMTDIGVTAIPAFGEQFDPNLHEAVMHMEDEAYGENEITAELQKGYIYKDKVIRHSMVNVAN